MPLFDTPDEDALSKTTSVRLPGLMWRQLDDIAAYESAQPIAKKLGVAYSRNEVIETMLKKEIALFWKSLGKEVPTPPKLPAAHADRRKPGGSRKTREEHNRSLHADHGKTEK